MEVWKKIEGFDGYEVSSLGRVRSFKLSSQGRLMKFRKKQGAEYLCVAFRKVPGGKKYKFTVSRLVARAFIPNPDNKPCVCHKDDNPANNRANNLFWGTFRENTQDMIRKGRRRGGRHKRPVVCLDTGEYFPSVTEAARSIGRDRMSLKSCVDGRTRTCANLLWEYVKR